MRTVHFLFLAALVACKGGGDDTDPPTDTDDTDVACTEARFYADDDGDGYGDPLTAVDACEAPQGYLDNDDDCDDAVPTVNPSVAEICNGVDDDCSGAVDDVAVEPEWYGDADGDGFGDATDVAYGCDQPVGYVDEAGDCNDDDGDVHPGASETDCADPTDYNCDGSVAYVDADKDGFAACEECNDADASVHPDAAEQCDGIDQDCDGETDEDAIDATTFYEDGDGDRYGVETSTVVACDEPEGYAPKAGDCNDGDPAYNPAAVESDCTDPEDYNCDGSTTFDDVDEDGFPACEDCDDSDPSVTIETTFYADTDEDGFGDADATLDACLAPRGYVADDTDCDDANGRVNPDAVEVCNTIDDDCDTSIDEADADDAKDWYVDGDGDGYGTGTPTHACTGPTDSVDVGGDCNDADGAVHPGATEVCDADDVDEDCDDGADDLDPDGASGTTAFYADGDEDGYGVGTAVMQCDPSTSHPASVDGDCNDGVATVNPGADEVCDEANTDEDCDGQADDLDDDATGTTAFYADGDSDTYGAGAAAMQCDPSTSHPASRGGDCDDAAHDVNPGATEACDGDDFDEDCDGGADDLDPEGASGKTTFYADGDSDTYGSGAGVARCDASTAYPVTVGGDCDDANPDANPGEVEICDADDVDEDCDEAADDADTGGASGKTTFYADGDGDTYGVGAGALQCDPSTVYPASRDGDCDDAVATVNPGATEVCDGLNVDEDCDTKADDLDPEGATGTTRFYADGDTDTWGAGAGSLQCDATTGFPVSRDGDCDDTNEDVNPGGTEIAANGLDDDCVDGDREKVGYAHTQWPCWEYELVEGDDLDVYGWVWWKGVTDSVGQGEGILAEAGYGPVETDPEVDDTDWVWVEGTYNGDKDGLSTNDNDEYKATFLDLPAGDWSFVWRFSTDDGATWVYGDLGPECDGGSGSDDGGTNYMGGLGVADPDLDDDGYWSTSWGGDDCNDEDATVHPGAEEDPFNGNDDDCDDLVDEYVKLAELVEGDLVITEIMYRSISGSTTDTGEYVEITNLTGDTVMLDDLTFADGTTSVTVTGGTAWIGGYGTFVLGRSTDPTANGGAGVDYAWGSMVLNNTGEALKIEYTGGAIVFDTMTTYAGTGWPTSTAGYAIELSKDALDATRNDDAASWCHAVDRFGTSTLGNALYGTPGADNTGC